MKKTLCTLSMICVAFIGQSQVIPNGNFESWTNGEPTYWFTNNNLTNYLIGLPVTGITPAPEGDSCMAVSPRISSQIPFTIPAVASVVFATQSRPLSFEGAYKQSQLILSDSANAWVSLFKVDTTNMTEIIVGLGFLRITGGNSNWNNFAVPINYFSADLPDSCRVSISGFGSANSICAFDNLRLTMTNSITESQSQNIDWMLYPNPTNENLTLSLAALGFLGETQLEIFSTDGKLVHTEKMINAMNPTLNIAHLPNGQYELALRNGNRRLVKAFVKN